MAPLPPIALFPLRISDALGPAPTLNIFHAELGKLPWLASEKCGVFFEQEALSYKTRFPAPMLAKALGTHDGATSEPTHRS